MPTPKAATDALLAMAHKLIPLSKAMAPHGSAVAQNWALSFEREMRRRGLVVLSEGELWDVYATARVSPFARQLDQVEEQIVKLLAPWGRSR